MFHDIFVGVMIVMALGAGIWCWWYENFEPKDKKKAKKEETNAGKSDIGA